MKFTLSLIVAVLPAFITPVLGHGFVQEMTVDGKPFKGNTPNANPFPSVIRQVNSVEPVKGAKNPAINCGPNAQIAALEADARPGSEIAFDWAGGDGSNWPHDTGSMFTYLTNCNGPCKDFKSGNADWFKIDQVARDASGKWVQAQLRAGGVAKVKLPDNLKAGHYLIRHEIFGLHLAENPGGAEFYESCAQINVSGNGNGVPKVTDLVKLPGAYSDSDPGILYRDAFNPTAKYIFPGPDVAKLGPGGASAPAPAPSPSPSPSNNSGSSGSCQAAKQKAKAKAKRSPVIELKARETPTVYLKTAHRHPRHFAKRVVLDLKH